LSALPPKRVAFFVGLSDNLGPVKEQTTVIFDRIVTNIGDAFNPQTGRFTAPINGTYQFNVVISAQGRQKVKNFIDYQIFLMPIKIQTIVKTTVFVSNCCSCREVVMQLNFENAACRR
jgi:C1q domain